MGTVPGSLLLEYKKTAPYPTWDKSCTPAIPPKLTFWKTSARFTRHHACPMDNGWVPVGIYLVSLSSRPRKSIRPAAPRLDPTTQGSLLHSSQRLCRLEMWRPLYGGRFALPATTLSHRFVCCLVVGAIIAALPPLVNPQFFNSLKKIFQGPAGTAGP